MFKHSFIPRNLDEVIDFERDVIMAKEGQTEGVCEVLCIQKTVILTQEPYFVYQWTECLANVLLDRSNI